MNNQLILYIMNIYHYYLHNINENNFNKYLMNYILGNLGLLLSKLYKYRLLHSNLLNNEYSI